MDNHAKNNREYGLDIFRSVSMLMVIVIHVIGYGGLREAYAPGSVGDWAVSLAEIAVYPAVDCFVLISGFLLSSLPFKLSRIVRTWLSATFWSILIQCVFFLMNPETISPGTVLYMFLPVLGEKYWFLNAYVVMMLVSPGMNHLLRELPRWKMRGLLLALLAVFCVAPIFAFGKDVFKTQNGNAFPWFIVMYLCGGYVRRYYPASQRKGTLLLGYLLLVFGHLLWVQLTEVAIPGMGLSGLFMKYTSLPVFGLALCLLQIFRSVRFSSNNCWIRLAQKISPLVFAVYLIHDHPLVRASCIQGKLANAGQLSWVGGLSLVIGVVLGIFMLCIFLEWLRSLLFQALGVDKAVEKLCGKITEKWRTY